MALLLGGGYAISRLAEMLAPHSFIITSTTRSKVAAFRARGWDAEFFASHEKDSLAKIFEIYPRITQVVDSIPPQAADALEVPLALSTVKTLRPLERVIYLSTTGVYGVNDGSWVNENTAPNPKHMQSELRLAVEDCYRLSGNKFTAFRLPAIYGPGRGIGLALKQGRYRLLDDGSDWTNRIHREDLALALKTALEIKDLPGLICVNDDRPARSRTVVEWYCKKFELPFPTSISRAEAEAQGQFTRLSNQRVSTQLMKSVLKLELKYKSFEEGGGTEFEER